MHKATTVVVPCAVVDQNWQSFLWRNVLGHQLECLDSVIADEMICVGSLRQQRDDSMIQLLAVTHHIRLNLSQSPYIHSNLQGSYRHSYAFFQDFPGLGKTKFKAFPGLKNPFFQDFPGNVPFKTLVARGQKVHIQNRLQCICIKD